MWEKVENVASRNGLESLRWHRIRVNCHTTVVPLFPLGLLACVQSMSCQWGEESGCMIFVRLAVHGGYIRFIINSWQKFAIVTQYFIGGITRLCLKLNWDFVYEEATTPCPASPLFGRKKRFLALFQSWNFDRCFSMLPFHSHSCPLAR